MVGLLFSMQRLFSESLARQELAFTNTLLATQLELSPDAVLVVDDQAKIISYNRRFVDLWGLTPETVAARADAPVLRSVAAQVRDAEAFLARIDHLYEHRSEESHDEIELRDGRVIDRHSAPMRGENGRYYGRVWFFRDITGRKRTEQAIADERALSNTLIASLPGVFYVLDSTGRFNRWNDAMRDLLGLTDAQMATYSALAAIHEADRASVARKIQEGFESGTVAIDARVVAMRGPRDYSFQATRTDTAKGTYLVGVGTDVSERKRAQEGLRRSEVQLAEAQRISKVGSWELDHATGQGSWSAEAHRILELDSASSMASMERFLAAVHPDDRAALADGFGRSLREHASFYEIDHRLRMPDGRIKHVHERSQTSFDELGRPLRTVGTIQDITDRVRSEQQIKLFRTLLDSAPDEIHVADPITLRIIDVNESACVALGYTRDEFLALRVPDFDTGDPEMHKGIGERLLRDGSATFETHHKRKDGVTFPVEVSVRLVTLDRPYTFAISRDITERKRVEEEVQNLQAQLRDQAVHDPLTGLHNRRYLDETMRRELVRAARYDQPVGIVMCDIDHFKVVNDRYGHPAGDEVLRAVARLLNTGGRGSDVACRYGGEEFVLLFPDMPRDAAYARAEQLRVALAAKRITSGAAAIQITASFGVAVFPENGTTVDALIGAADLAMYEAKKAGRNRVVVASGGIAPLPAAGRSPAASSPAGREST
ncbi:MAG: diguanylate cyclase [Casimicrobiaceae bacterium]